MDEAFPCEPEEIQTPIPEKDSLAEDFDGSSPSGDLEAQELPDLLTEEAQPVDDMKPTQGSRPERKRRSVWRSILSVLTLIGKCLLAAALIVVVLVAGLIGYLTVTEYTPAYSEAAQRGAVDVTAAYPPEVEQSAESSVAAEQPSMTLRLLSFNTGFSGLGEDADFFMDGG